MWLPWCLKLIRYLLPVVMARAIIPTVHPHPMARDIGWITQKKLKPGIRHHLNYTHQNKVLQMQQKISNVLAVIVKMELAHTRDHQLRPINMWVVLKTGNIMARVLFMIGKVIFIAKVIS